MSDINSINRGKLCGLLASALACALPACSGDDASAGGQSVESGGAAGAGSNGSGGAAGSQATGGGTASGGSETGGSQTGGGQTGGSAGSGVGGAGIGGAGGAATGGVGNGGAGGSGAGGSAARTCGEAGGNRCAAAASACAGLKSFSSSDCKACCLVPENPIIAGNWADPFIARDGDTYVALATGSTVRRRTSKNLVNWTAATAALESAPWKKASFGFWAPTLYKAKNGKWILYYASERSGSTQKCIGRAVSDSPTGKFVDSGNSAFLCRSSYWSIDPSVFTDTDGKDYLLWRQDTAAQSGGNAFIQPLDDAGRLKGSEHQLISRAQSEPSWEFDSSGGVLENPAMTRGGGYHHLFYSGFRWETANYANGHAICDTPLGPCTKRSVQTPWLGSQGGMKGPGGADFVTAADGTRFIYMHGWTPKVGDGGARSLWLYRFDINGKNASIAPL